MRPLLHERRQTKNRRDIAQLINFSFLIDIREGYSINHIHIFEFTPIYRFKGSENLTMPGEFDQRMRLNSSRSTYPMSRRFLKFRYGFFKFMGIIFIKHNIA